ncbi:MAG: A/G-specific adenine glycosylase [Hyphomonadaceae bacterium]|nr:A/G-specific adenine glycosylase [Hyphomonadaceae bacterium]
MGYRNLSAALLAWYSRAARDLPWRVGPAERAQGERPGPYGVWLSEVMLQQTTIAHATRYWLDFTSRWPRVEDLAAARDEEVMTAWAGLGYYARARNLLKCARIVAERGGFPETRAELQALPGIGPYTSGAIAAIAFDQRAAAVDGNVERVMARLLAAKGDWAFEKMRIREVVEMLVPAERPGEFAEAMMDLGATVCTPKAPNCLICPLSEYCAARAEGEPERYPIKPKRAAKPKRKGVALVLISGGQVKVLRRPDSGLLGGMLALPSTEWGEEGGDVRALCRAEGGLVSSLTELGEVRHVFTHFELTLSVWQAKARTRSRGEWRPPEEVEGLPSVFAKAFRLAYPSRPISER